MGSSSSSSSSPPVVLPIKLVLGLDGSGVSTLLQRLATVYNGATIKVLPFDFEERKLTLVECSDMRLLHVGYHGQKHYSRGMWLRLLDSHLLPAVAKFIQKDPVVLSVVGLIWVADSADSDPNSSRLIGPSQEAHDEFHSVLAGLLEYNRNRDHGAFTQQVLILANKQDLHHQAGILTPEQVARALGLSSAAATMIEGSTAEGTGFRVKVRGCSAKTGQGMDEVLLS